MIENEINPNDALLMVHLRNEFYKKKYYLIFAINLLSLLIIVILFFILDFLLTNPTRPLYFPTDKIGRLIQDTPISVANLSEDEVGAWAKEAVEAAYSYDYVNYRSQLQDVQRYFTDKGWHNFMLGLKASNNLEALTREKAVFVARVFGKPKSTGTAFLGGAYAWRFEMQMLVNYYYPPYSKPNFQNAYLTTVIIVRLPLLQSYQGKGLGVLQMYNSPLS